MRLADRGCLRLRLQHVRGPGLEADVTHVHAAGPLVLQTDLQEDLAASLADLAGLGGRRGGQLEVQSVELVTIV